MSSSYQKIMPMSTSGASGAGESHRSPVGNPYAVIPPVGRLLDAIVARCAVGETITPGNRTLAKWVGLTSIGSIPASIAQLARDEWIRYNPHGGKITLLRTPYASTPDSAPLSDSDPFDPYLDRPDEIIDYLLSLPRQRPRSGGAE